MPTAPTATTGNRRVKRLIHDGRDRVFLPKTVKIDGKVVEVVDVHGKPIVLGSKDDRGVAGTYQNEVEVDAELWERLVQNNKTIQGLISGEYPKVRVY